METQMITISLTLNEVCAIEQALFARISWHEENIPEVKTNRTKYPSIVKHYDSLVSALEKVSKFGL